MEPRATEREPFARVCSYDRAGDGWSDIGPHPRTFRQIVYELHTLLERAGERPPYVLVGHSYGGWLVRQYQMTYPSEVAGMVLVEAGADDPWRMTPDGKLKRSSELAGRTDPSREDVGTPARRRHSGTFLAQINADRGVWPRAQRAARDKLPPDAQRMRAWALGTMKHWSSSDNPFEADEILGLAQERTKTEYPYGDLPLIVITRGLSEEEGPDSKMFAAEHRKDHEAQAKLSRRGKLIVAERSGHYVQIDEPELVIGAIREIIAARR